MVNLALKASLTAAALALLGAGQAGAALASLATAGVAALPLFPTSCWCLAACLWPPPTGRCCPRPAPASSVRCLQR